MFVGKSIEAGLLATCLFEMMVVGMWLDFSSKGLGIFASTLLHTARSLRIIWRRILKCSTFLSPQY